MYFLKYLQNRNKQKNSMTHSFLFGKAKVLILRLRLFFYVNNCNGLKLDIYSCSYTSACVFKDKCNVSFLI